MITGYITEVDGVSITSSLWAARRHSMSCRANDFDVTRTPINSVICSIITLDHMPLLYGFIFFIKIFKGKREPWT